MRLIPSSSLKLISVLALTTLLSACGFHLRGDYSVPEELHRMSLTSYDQYSTFTRMVKNQLRVTEIELVSPAKDVPNLHLLSEGVGERTLSLYQNTRAAEKELTFNASYRVTVPDVGTKVFSTSVTRSYLDNPLTALAKSVERDMIEDEMRKVAASQILRQMARLKANIAASEMMLEAQENEEMQTIEKQYDIQTIEGELAPTNQSN
ncbi:LPS assembly lipoprotein LptE [Vibrio aestuarianus]|uniref:LPS-assembly lipoprotein LptE n=1 Tax=Vibrio aestuarianus TaxID=28171 RepID=A0A9X4F1C3_9VIBR|nr:LPS assembly lipoprotein LptE [Vibrio aestuarianus]MDE1242776.1 LPS assembly lipoprotein LptE [Vibrio aestuarianus]MDE1325843.1 LPS assembly lipoprotein LptE [Vibrio aestuarianus]MDE1329879.1 LPS assembly lipoprotein LptE [Vibrio aestuarianus]MDE1339548.1 LPS assembly lipoprotein LptE [Vibrio aestuarianus]MDE1349810.1 LPS assembly lipoprotein LptE [Vibrio aestuarianus]